MEDWYSINSYEDMVLHRLQLICNTMKELEETYYNIFELLQDHEEKITEINEQVFDKEMEKHAIKKKLYQIYHYLTLKLKKLVCK